MRPPPRIAVLLAERSAVTTTASSVRYSNLGRRRCFGTAAGGSSASSPIFFLSNRLFARSTCLDSVIRHNRSSSTATTTTTATATASPPNAQDDDASPTSTLAPHRRRQQARKLQEQQQEQQQPAEQHQKPLPPDASSILSAAAASHPSNSLRRTLSALLALTKPRLTVLIVLSAMVPYALYPVPEMLTPSMTATPSLSPLTLLFLTTGTTLCCASANTFNMLYEPATDAKMTRTRNRPLVRGLLSKRGAALFGVLAGAAGVGALYFGVNPTVSGLGLSNIVLYAGVYTPLKAVTVLNTWVGAVVGGIPPLMGWAAAAGQAATRDGTWRELLLAPDGSSLGGWLMASLLFAWQFPHFMALSWPIRHEYRAAGLRMLAWTNPARNARVALRYSLFFAPLSLALCAAGVTSWVFVASSAPLNFWIAREAVRFWRTEGNGGSARGLFWASVWHLPGFMILALLHKKGMWERAWRAVSGLSSSSATDDGEWEDDEELQEMVAMTANKVAEKDTASGVTR